MSTGISPSRAKRARADGACRCIASVAVHPSKLAPLADLREDKQQITTAGARSSGNGSSATGGKGARLILPAPTASQTAAISDGGFDWGDAGIGAAGGLAIALHGVGGGLRSLTASLPKDRHLGRGYRLTICQPQRMKALFRGATIDWRWHLTTAPLAVRVPNGCLDGLLCSLCKAHRPVNATVDWPRRKRRAQAHHPPMTTLAAMCGERLLRA